MIRAIKLGDKSGYLITKGGLVLGGGSLGAVIASIAIGWIALGNTNSLNKDNKNLVNNLEHQIRQAREANCKLKLYDVLSGRAGTLLFKRAHVINKFFEKGINHTLEIVESIPSEKNCTAIFSVSNGEGKKKIGGLTSADIKYANEVLGEILEEPSGFKRRNENKIKKSLEHKIVHHRRHRGRRGHHKLRRKKKYSQITKPPGPVVIVVPPAMSQIPSVLNSSSGSEENNSGNYEEKKKEQGIHNKERNKQCMIEVGVLKQKVKVCI